MTGRGLGLHRTITTLYQIYIISNSEADDTQNPLVFLLELLFVKHLDRQDAIFGYFPDGLSILVRYKGQHKSVGGMKFHTNQHARSSTGLGLFYGPKSCEHAFHQW